MLFSTSGAFAFGRVRVVVAVLLILVVSAPVDGVFAIVVADAITAASIFGISIPVETLPGSFAIIIGLDKSATRWSVAFGVSNVEGLPVNLPLPKTTSCCGIFVFPTPGSWLTVWAVLTTVFLMVVVVAVLLPMVSVGTSGFSETPVRGNASPVGAGNDTYIGVYE